MSACIGVCGCVGVCACEHVSVCVCVCVGVNVCRCVRVFLQCLDLKVDQVLRMWASLSQARLPVKENQRIKGQIQRCHRVLSLADSFHQTADQVNCKLSDVSC